jgi:2',3'-cyclic-nucleotide 2'-phosphodiesterase (5'-nucleotidase family)
VPGVDAEGGAIHGKPALMAGFWGSHLGIIDLWLEMDTRWQVVEPRIEVRPIARRDANGRAIALVKSDASRPDLSRRSRRPEPGVSRRHEQLSRQLLGRLPGL